MNFYSVDGIIYDNSTYQNYYSDNIDNFDNVPITSSKLSDDLYKCSDAYEIIDDEKQKSTNYINFTDSECKEKCMNNNDCVAFNYNSSIKVCQTLSNATSLYNLNKDNTFCVKKNSYSICDIPKTSIPLPGMKTMAETTEFSPKAMVDKVKKPTCKINNTYAFAQLDNLFEKIQNKNESKSDNFVFPEIVNNVGPIINKINDPTINNTGEAFIDAEAFSESPMFPKFCDTLLGTIDKCKLNIDNKNLPSNNIDNKNMNFENFSNIEMDRFQNMSEQEMARMRNMSEQEMNKMRNMPEQEMARMRNMSEQEMGRNMSEQEMSRMRNMSEQEMARMRNMSEQEMARMRNMSEQEMNKDMLKPKIYVDLNCFMNKMQNFSSHSDNIMIDVNLLTSNIKSCAYVSKTDEISKMNKPQGNLVDQITALIDIPKVESIDLDKLKIRENFEQVENKNSQNNFNLFSSDLIKIIIIILIMYMVLFRKK